MRPRKKDRHLPACMYFRHGSYWYVKRGKWTNLGPHLATALAEYARLIASGNGEMAKFIDDTLPSILVGKSANTQRQYKSGAKALKHVFQDMSPQEIRPRDVHAMMDAHADRYGIANRMLSVLRILLDKAVKAQLIDSNPCVGAKKFEVNKRTRRITVTEYWAIYDAAPPRMRAWLALAVLTGQRIGDVLKIRRSDCTPEGIAFEQQKTGNRLIVAWSPELKEAVAYADGLHGSVASLWLCKGSEGRPMAYSMALRDWVTATEKAKVSGATIHDLRAMSGTEAKAQGKNAQALLGHANEKQTATYLRDRVVPVVEGPSIGLVKKTGVSGQ